jgi:hypothetical protein
MFNVYVWVLRLKALAPYVQYIFTNFCFVLSIKKYSHNFQIFLWITKSKNGQLCSPWTSTCRSIPPTTTYPKKELFRVKRFILPWHLKDYRHGVQEAYFCHATVISLGTEQCTLIQWVPVDVTLSLPMFLRLYLICRYKTWNLKFRDRDFS